MRRINKDLAPYFNKYSSNHNKTAIAIRNSVLTIIPDAKEIIKYNMPTYQLNGNDICGILINKSHIGFYPYSGSIISKFPEIQSKFVTTKGSIHIPIGSTFPKSLLTKLIKARISTFTTKRREAKD